MCTSIELAKVGTFFGGCKYFNILFFLSSLITDLGSREVDPLKGGNNHLRETLLISPELTFFYLYLIADNQTCNHLLSMAFW